MARLFNRSVALTVERVTKEFSARELQLSGFIPTFNRQLRATSTDRTIIRDLRVTFDIEKTLKKDPNSAEITVYNLAERTRFRFQEKPLHVRLDAGYDGFLERVFSGDLRWAESRHEGVDWETRMQLGDGDRAVRFGHVSRSFKGGVTIRTALTEAAKEMGFTLPNSVTASDTAGQYVSGLSLHGNAGDELTRLLTPLGLAWSVQDGRLQILNERTTRPGEALLIAQDTGMIGTPEYGAPEKKGKPPVLTFRTLLKPALMPGGKVKLETTSINGVFRVERVRHSGDTHGEDWTSEVECRQVQS